MNATALARARLGAARGPGRAPARLLSAAAGPATRRPGRAPAWLLTAAAGLVYVILAPPAPDLAAASYRSWLISNEGFTLWDNSWYGGHHLPAYSLLAPALGALIGPQLLAALSMTAATALFAALVRGRFPERSARIASLWFALGASVALLSCRVPFDLGLALGLGSLLAAQRRRAAVAVPLALLCALASPVAGAFLALALVAWALGGVPRARLVALLAAVAVPIGLLVLVFPEGGSQPFAGSAFYPALAGVIAIGLLMPPEQRLLRIGAALYALSLTASFVIASAMGGNADRLGALAAGPIAACALAGAEAGRRRRIALALLAPLLLYWQANAPAADFASAIEDPATAQSFYRPLLGELRALGVGYGARPARIEVVPSVDHWEARWVAPAMMMARGWERQLDRYRNGLFYAGSPPSAASYHAWLSEQGVAFVALPDSPLDYSAKAEAQLLRGPPLPYLDEVWRSPHWRLFAVRRPTPLAAAPAQLTAAGRDWFTLAVPRAGSYLARIRFTPYWALAGGHGCVAEAPGGFTEVRTRSAGTTRVVIAFALGRIFDHGPRCR
ncbi:MAG TPA: hypothetical protein VHT27_04310 [Solirubrobacteraceae bacterium]|nr:hypothetical protein [Solirubrobacteraceae bacterium]